MNPHFWWYVARSSGIVAWGLSTAAVLWGLWLSSRALGKRPAAPWLLAMHRYLGALTVLFVGAHIGALVADSYVHFGWAQVLVPFASAWRTTAVAWGVIAFWLLLAVEISSLLMKRIPKKWWKGIHLSSYAVFGLATIHGLTAGTDTHNSTAPMVAIITSLVVVFFTLYRVIGPSKSDRSGRERVIPSRQAIDTETATGSAAVPTSVSPRAGARERANAARAAMNKQAALSN